VIDGKGAVWITGGAGGVGRELAIALANRGWPVGVCDIDDDGLASLADSVDDGAVIATVHADIAREDQVARAYGELTEALGPISGLVNNALHADNRRLVDLSVDEWRRCIDVSLTGYFLCTQVAVRKMLEAGYGRIVNMSSGSAERGIPGTGAYAAAKGGVNAITRTLAVEVATHGITVNTLTLGPVMTEGFAKLAVNQDGIEARRRRVPVGRLGATADCVGLVELLLDPSSAWITGGLFHVDGGANNAGLVQATDSKS
jgi:NAD(P)-dependent dehydrogenase (short-subunit alcohol dehydrogenase family)